MRLTPLAGFLRKELSQALRDRRMKVMLFAMPVVQLLLFGLALSNEIKNIRLASYNAPFDTLAARVQEKAVASGWFVNAEGEDLDPVSLITGGKADAVLVSPPEGLAKSIARGDGRVQLLIDAGNAVRARSIEAYVQRVLADTLVQSGTGAPPAALAFDIRVLYNPSLETVIFMVPGVMVMILALVTIVLTSMSIAREREMGTLEMLISTPVGKWEILLGKTLPYLLLALADVPLILLAGRLLFGVPIRGPLWVLFVASLFFLITTVSVGTLISTFARDQQQAMMGGFMFMMPAILLSGIMYPIENMPPAIKWISELNPLRHFATLLRNIMLKGGDSTVVLTHVGVLAALALVTFSLAAHRFRNRLN